MSREQDERNFGTADLVAAADRRSQEPVREERMPDERMDGQVQDVEAREPQQRGEALAALFDPGAADAFRAKWKEVQVGFVDDPRRAVAHADELVAQVMKSLAESFAGQRSRIEQEVGQGEEVSTENLRVALTRYRSFFERLLSL